MNGSHASSYAEPSISTNQSTQRHNPEEENRLHRRKCRLGGVMVFVWLPLTQSSRVQNWPRRWICKGDKNSQHLSLEGN
jgi:hypothetical protein